MDLLIAPIVGGIVAYLVMSAICLHQLANLYLPVEEKLQDWQRELEMHRSVDLRQFVPDRLFQQAKQQIRIWSICIAVFVGSSMLAMQLPGKPVVFDLRWLDLIKLVPTVLMTYETINRGVAVFNLKSDRHVSFRAQSTNFELPYFVRVLFLIFWIFLIVENLQIWMQNRNAVSEVLDAILMLIACVFLFSLRSDTIVGRTGLLLNNSYISSYLSPQEIHEYRLYENRNGVLFICEPKASRPPLMIVSVPEEQFDEVAEILAEYLPDKREEDVEPALARIELAKEEESQLDPVV